MNRNQIWLFAVLLLLAFAFGRYTGQQQNTKSQSDTTSKETTKRQTIIIKEPGGRETTTINERIDATEHIKQSQQIGVKRKSFNVSGLVGIQDGRFYNPTYGISVSGEVLGPITISGFGLTNGILGVGIGVNF